MYTVLAVDGFVQSVNNLRVSAAFLFHQPPCFPSPCSSQLCRTGATQAGSHGRVPSLDLSLAWQSGPINNKTRGRPCSTHLLFIAAGPGAGSCPARGGEDQFPTLCGQHARPSRGLRPAPGPPGPNTKSRARNPGRVSGTGGAVRMALCADLSFSSRWPWAPDRTHPSTRGSGRT